MSKRDFPSYEMYTQEGDVAVHRMVTCIVTDLNLGRIRRLELPGRIRQGCDWVADQAGHKEVFDTEPQVLITAAINRAAEAQGWQPVSRWDW